MRKGTTLTLTGPNTSAKLEPGKLEISDDTMAPSVRLKMTITLANAGGSPYTLSDADKQNLFGGFSLDMGWGAGLQHQPYQALPLNKLDTDNRYLGGSEWQGYADSSSGLAQAIPNAGNKQMVAFVRVPTGLFWQDEDRSGVWGMGKQQAASAQMVVKRNTDFNGSAPANITISGNVTFDVVPDELPAHGEERVTPIPLVREWAETDKVVKLADCIPLGIFETTNANASATITSNTLQIGTVQLYDQISPSEYIAPYHDTPNLPTAADVSDRFTLVHVLPRRTKIEDIKAGPVRFVQNGVKMTSFAAHALFIEYLTPAQIDADLQLFAGSKGLNRAVNAVNYAALRQWSLPAALLPMMPTVLLDQGDARFEKLPGRLVGPGIAPQYFLPASQRAKQRGSAASHKAAGELRAAESVARLIASSVPGAVTSSQGFDGGTNPVLDWARSQVA